MENQNTIQSIGEILQKAHGLQQNNAEALESYSHVDLTDDELIEAIIWAKKKKEVAIKHLELREREDGIRKLRWDFDIIKTFMVNRAKEIFKGQFQLDENNEEVFDLLCHYFVNSEAFESKAAQLGIDNPHLEKGIMLAGNFGSGKTWLMKLFAKNKKMPYFMRSAKRIAQEYLQSETKEIPQEYLKPFKNAVNDASVFYQPLSGLCIDDLGSEDIKNNFGNKTNVIGDLIEQRYFKEFYGVFLHGSTNLSGQELKTFYGERVVSRMKQVFNFIELPGNDRRR